MMGEDSNGGGFERLVEDAQRAAERSLSVYKFRVALFALFGYTVIFVILAILIGLVSGIVAVSIYSPALLIILLSKKLVFLLIPAIWILFRSVWVKLEPPTGYRITAADCPRLFAEIESLRSALDAMKIHQVILTPELNAAVSRTPRLTMIREVMFPRLTYSRFIMNLRSVRTPFSAALSLLLLLLAFLVRFLLLSALITRLAFGFI